MKKILILILVLFTLYISGCSRIETFEEEYEAAYKANLEAYKNRLKMYNRKLTETEKPDIEIYYGKYGDTYVVDPNLINNGTFAEMRYNVAGYTFVFPQHSFVAYAIYKNVYYDLDEAYEKGYLKLDDVKQLYEVHQQQNGYLLETKNAYYNKFLRNIEGAKYTDVTVLELYENIKTDKKLQSICKFSSPYIENKKVDEVYLLGSLEFKYEYFEDIIYVMYNYELYALDEANLSDDDYLKIYNAVYNK